MRERSIFILTLYVGKIGGWETGWETERSETVRKGTACQQMVTTENFAPPASVKCLCRAFAIFSYICKLCSPQRRQINKLQTMSIIEIKNVSKSFGEKVALDNVSLEIPEGQIFGFLGPNGAGKTTLIRIINRITIPSAGEVLFQGKRITQRDVEKIGYMPEERGLYRKMKVGEQAMYLAQLKGMSSSQAQQALKEWFVRFGIEGWWDKKVEELSKGMAQKLQFITTVVHKPKLMILDEPFSGFDPVNAEIIRKEILRLKEEGATIILSTHNMESVEELCDSIALINKSKLVITGDVNEIRREYGNNNVELVYTDADGRHEVVLPRETDGTSTLESYLAKGVTINSYKELMPRMNDIFIKLVTEGR